MFRHKLKILFSSFVLTHQGMVELAKSEFASELEFRGTEFEKKFEKSSIKISIF